MFDLSSVALSLVVLDLTEIFADFVGVVRVSFVVVMVLQVRIVFSFQGFAVL